MPTKLQRVISSFLIWSAYKKPGELDKDNLVVTRIHLGGQTVQWWQWTSRRTSIILSPV